MANVPSNPDSSGDTYYDTGVAPGIARWQKVLGIIGLVVVLGLGVLMFGLGGGGHGPSQHAPDESQEQQIETVDGGGHNPSQSGH